MAKCTAMQKTSQNVAKLNYASAGLDGRVDVASVFTFELFEP
jgi:hypothetical protein